MLSGSNKTFVPFRLEALTPVHIGSGEDFSPLGYVIRQKNETGYEAWLIDTAAWLAANMENPEIAKALEAGDMLALRRLLNLGNPGAFVLGKIGVDNSGLGKELLRKRNSLENSAEIMSFTRNPFTHTPFVPASSIKGAITTALADFLNERRKARKEPSLREAAPKEYRKIMEEMFGNIQRHAMRGLGLADIALPAGATSIRAATGVGLAPENTMPKTPCETLDPPQPELPGAFGNLRFKAADGLLVFPDGARVSLKKLGEICTDFYRKRYKAEFEKFYKRPHLAATGKALEDVTRRIENCDGEREILLRIGRYSHIECVTVSGEPPRMPKGCGKTRTLANMELPFGWVILSFCSMDDYNRGLQELDISWKRELQEQAELEERRQKRLREEEERKRVEEEEARKRELALAAMSPEERSIWELGQATATENQASAVYGALSGYGEMKMKAAQALMEFWKRIDKWEGRQLSKKQKEKVAAVKKILGI